MSNLQHLQERSAEILAKAEKWKNEGGFAHNKPCKDWKTNKDCIHYAKARYKHFKAEIDLLLEEMGF
jgi:hypothetical protein